jgi:hypothetical protein
MFETLFSLLNGGMAAVNEAHTREDNGHHRTFYGSLSYAEDAHDSRRHGAHHGVWRSHPTRPGAPVLAHRARPDPRTRLLRREPKSCQRYPSTP